MRSNIFSMTTLTSHAKQQATDRPRRRKWGANPPRKYPPPHWNRRFRNTSHAGRGPLAVAVLVIATVINLGWAFREAIPKDGPTARLLDSIGVPGFEPPPPFRDPSRIHLLARDIHDHPSRPGVLVLSATFINLAEQAQPYPAVAVVLKNSDNQPLAARRFEPADYLLSAPPEGAGLDPNEQVPLLLEFADPGERATGYDITFH